MDWFVPDGASLVFSRLIAFPWSLCVVDDDHGNCATLVVESQSQLLLYGGEE